MQAEKGKVPALSKELAAFATGLKYEDLSENAIYQAKMCIEDIIGVSMAGSAKPAARLMQQTVAGLLGEKTADSAGRKATLWQKGLSAQAPAVAAWLNGSFGHTIDMDDLHNSSIIHLAVVTVPAALAVAEALGSSGKDLILAVAAGYEVGARVGEAVNPSSYWFWHTTGTAGNFSAAAAVGSLLKLNAEEMNCAFAQAGTQAAGLWEFMYDGAMSKSLHTGKANFNGILAAYLAKAGFTGAQKILEGEKGFVKAVAPEYDLLALTRNFGKPYRIETNSFKPYACCRHIHSGIYAVFQAKEKYGLKPQDIAAIADRTYKTAVELTDNPAPATPYGHKFSIQYCLAAAMFYDNMYDASFSTESVNNAEVRDLMARVSVCADDKLQAEFAADGSKWVHEVDFLLHDGRKICQRVEYPFGDYQNPFGWADEDKKFCTLTADVLGAEQQQKLLAKLHDLENCADVSRLFA